MAREWYEFIDIVLVVDGADIGWPAYGHIQLNKMPVCLHPPHGKAIYICLGATSMDDPWEPYTGLYRQIQG